MTTSVVIGAEGCGGCRGRHKRKGQTHKKQRGTHKRNRLVRKSKSDRGLHMKAIKPSTSKA